MECVQRWSADRGLRIEPYGLDISTKLAALARRRLPHWVDRIFIGNVIDWDPPMRFDFVRTGLEYVPPRRGADLLRHLLSRVVAPGGRLIVGTHNEEKKADRSIRTLERTVTSWHLRIAGRSERNHFHDGRLQYRVFWIDRDG